MGFLAVYVSCSTNLRYKKFQTVQELPLEPKHFYKFAFATTIACSHVQPGYDIRVGLFQSFSSRPIGMFPLDLMK